MIRTAKTYLGYIKLKLLCTCDQLACDGLTLFMTGVVLRTYSVRARHACSRASVLLRRAR